MTFGEFWEEFKKDYDVWNMSLEAYNSLKAQALKIYNSINTK